MNRAACLLAGLLALSAGKPALAGQFNHNGNVLISDQFNNRVIEVDRNRQIVFQFGSGDPNLCNPGPGSVIAPNDVERLAFGFTLIAGTGTTACPDNRVIVVDPFGNIVFEYGQAGVSGSGPNQLNVPVFAIQDRFGNFLITDQGNNRIILVSPWRSILWSYGPTTGPGALNTPNSAEILPNGHVLIADENNSRVLEIDFAGHIVFEYSKGLNIVAFASRLPDGDTLIVDSGNNRVIEIDQEKRLVWQYHTNRQPWSNPNPNPTSAVRLRNGDTLIADQFNDRVIEVTHDKKVDFEYGMTDVVGNGPDQLDAPYNAVVIGQYIGVTRPPGQ